MKSSIYVKRQSFEVREFSVISFVLIAFCQQKYSSKFANLVFVTSLISSLFELVSLKRVRVQNAILQLAFKLHLQSTVCK